MKILHLTAQLPTRTGSGIYYKNLFDYLSLKGHEQAALYAVQDDYDFDFGESVYKVCFKTSDIPFAICGMSDVMPYDNTVYSSMDENMLDTWKTAFKTTLDRAMKEFKPDIVLSHHLWYLSSLCLNEYPKTPIYMFSHGTDIRQAKKHPDLLKQHVGSLRQAKKVFALSHAHIDDLMVLFDLRKEQIEVIGAGYDDRIFYRDPQRCCNNEGIVIVFCGKISHAKGVFELVEVFGELRQQFEDIYLDIIGDADPPSKKKLKNLQKKIPGILSYNAEDQLALGQFFRCRDIICLPSYFEGLGLVVLEAMACGARAVTTEIEGLKELLGPEVNRSGLIRYVALPRMHDVDKPVPEDIPAFKKRLKEALTLQIQSCRCRQDVQDKMIHYLEKHSWYHIAEKLDHIIKKG